MKEWEAAKRLPRELFVKAASAGFLPCVVGEWPEEHVGPKPDGYDHFFECKAPESCDAALAFPDSLRKRLESRIDGPGATENSILILTSPPLCALG